MLWWKSKNKKRISLTTETGRQGNHPPKCTVTQLLITMRPGTRETAEVHTTLGLTLKQESVATDGLHATEVLQDTIKALDFYLIASRAWE